ncbi:MAG: GAF domain-containing protein [Myxococcales bacterium]
MITAEAMLAALADLCGPWSAKLDLDARISHALGCLHEKLGYQHSMLLVPGEPTDQLVMLASHGYEVGVGAQVKVGEGAIGICAERRRGLRLNNLPRQIGVLQAAHEPGASSTEIALPGLKTVRSQLAAPLLLQGELVGVLYVEDENAGRFSADDSHALQLVASLLAPALFHENDDEAPVDPVPESVAEPCVTPLRVRYYAADGSVFFDDEYVIKSLPGRLLFKLLQARRDEARREFTKKELRLDPCLQLPAVRDNLDTRLILLRRRLAERFPFAQIVPVGRGRFRLDLERPFELIQADAKYP